MRTRSHISCCKINLTLIFYSLWMEGMRRARSCPVNHRRPGETPARRRQTETARQKDTHTLADTHTLQSHECLIGRRQAAGRGRELSLCVTLNGCRAPSPGERAGLWWSCCSWITTTRPRLLHCEERRSPSLHPETCRPSVHTLPLPSSSVSALCSLLSCFFLFKRIL